MDEEEMRATGRRFPGYENAIHFTNTVMATLAERMATTTMTEARKR